MWQLKKQQNDILIEDQNENKSIFVEIDQISKCIPPKALIYCLTTYVVL